MQAPPERRMGLPRDQNVTSLESPPATRPMDDKPFDRQNAAYAQALYEEFALNPEGVPEQWRDFFALGPQATAEAGLLVPEGRHHIASGRRRAERRPTRGAHDAPPPPCGRPRDVVHSGLPRPRASAFDRRSLGLRASRTPAARSVFLRHELRGAPGTPGLAGVRERARRVPG